MYIQLLLLFVKSTSAPFLNHLATQGKPQQSVP